MALAKAIRSIITLLFHLLAFVISGVSGNNNTDRVTLLEIKKAITNDPGGFLNSWNDSLHFCSWPGVQCSDTPPERVTSLLLTQFNLVGTLPPHVGNLSFLSFLSLDNNNFRGEIPPQLGNLLQLQHLNASYNSFHGVIPVNLSRCANLRMLQLAANNLQGTIPEELGSLAKLEALGLGGNDLSGSLPASIGNVSNLISYDAAGNNLIGGVPETYGQLPRLKRFVMGINNLSGTIPHSFYNLSSLQLLVLTYNQLEGSLPERLGHTLTDLTFFEVSGNNLAGTIPDSFCNASHLTEMNMNENYFVGMIPTCLGTNFGTLQLLDLGLNNLGYNNSADDFKFLTSLANCSKLRRVGISGNNFGGTLPDSLGNLSSTHLTQLLLAVNQITSIPETIQNLIGLIEVDLAVNPLSGTIPSFLGKLRNLQGLVLHGNDLSGEIPNSIGNLTKLVSLDLSSNRLTGQIPVSLANCLGLNYVDFSENKLSGDIPAELMSLPSLTKLLNLSTNSLTGNLPPEIGKLGSLNALDISYNALTGEIPTPIGDCKSLEHLFLQGNSFSGAIPSPLAALRSLPELDLSHNKLTGSIPPQLQNVPFFQYLNLSFNDLQGEVPRGGVFTNASAISLFENPQLCTGDIHLHLEKWVTKRASAAASVRVKRLIVIILVASVCAFLLVLSLAFVSVYKLRRSGKRQAIEYAIPDQFLRVSYADLRKATDDFSPDNVIGSGGFGIVYKGKLEEMEKPVVVAIKVLDQKYEGAYNSLAAECDALRNVRHRNIVKVLSFCSSLDHKGNEFKALVFQYMEKESLEDWLYGEKIISGDGANQPATNNNLNLVQMLNIAIDVASALHYLHTLCCETPIIHCDLKPSNVLLDAEMVGHVSDFGQARLLSSGDPSSHRTTTTTAVKGTVGYVAPEYGMGSAVSKQGDAYSYGILILEMFTRRSPTDETFREGMNLHDFVKAAVTAPPEELLSIIEPNLLFGEAQYDPRMVRLQMEKMQRCLISTLEVGVACSAESPSKRMTMADAAGKLQSIRNVLVQRR